MKNKMCFVILAILSTTQCTRVSQNEVGFWFDPRGKEFKDHQDQQKQLQQEQIERQKKLEQQRQTQQEVDRVRQARDEQSREELRQELAVHDKKMRELQEQQEAARVRAEQDRQRQYEENQAQQRACLEYRNNNCRDVNSTQCAPVKQCNSVNGTTVCWNEQQCSTTTSLHCTGKAPDGCSP